jgi:hypothetical protein
MAVMMVVGGAADAKPGLVANSTSTETGAPLNFEGIEEQELGEWLESLEKTKNGLSQKQVAYLSKQAHRCLIAVGDTPSQQVGSVVFGIPTNPNTSAGNKKLGDAMWRTHSYLISRILSGFRRTSGNHPQVLI